MIIGLNIKNFSKFLDKNVILLALKWWFLSKSRRKELEKVGAYNL